MLKHLHIFLLAALGGVRIQDAVEAAAYERLRPGVPRDTALDVPAQVICTRVDRVVRAARPDPDSTV